MTSSADDSALQDLDERLRELEARDGRDSDEFRRLSAEREQLLNARDDK